MKYFLLNVVGNVQNVDYCFTDNGPKGVLDGYDLISGLRVVDEYPDGIGETTLKLGEDYPGVELTSFLGNTSALLAVKKDAAEIIRSLDVGEVEVIPFKLLNHKGRVHSEDYVFLNPIGWVECLDMKKTTTLLHTDGSIIRIKKIVLDPAKLKGIPHLFRPKEDLRSYIFSEVLVTALQERRCTNFIFSEIEQG